MRHTRAAAAAKSPTSRTSTLHSEKPSPEPWPPLPQSFFDKMDTNGDGSVTKEEAIAFWGSNFAKVSAAPPRCPVPDRRRRRRQRRRRRRGCLHNGR